MTTAETTWGDPIVAANDGKPLPWLKADEGVLCKWGTIDGWGGPYSVSIVSGWTEGFQIKLPADHPYYLATSLGFTYWPGGDSEPDDWDGREVLLENCYLHPSFKYLRWARSDFGTDIIGYRKRTDTSDDYVRVKRMTEPEFRARILNNDAAVLAGNIFRIIREETPLEKFERAHGDFASNQRDIVNAFIAWQKNNG